MNKQIEECELKKVQVVANCIRCDETEYDKDLEELGYTLINAEIAYRHFIAASFGANAGMPFPSLSVAVRKGWMQLVVYLFQQNATAILAQIERDKEGPEYGREEV